MSAPPARSKHAHHEGPRETHVRSFRPHRGGKFSHGGSVALAQRPGDEGHGHDDDHERRDAREHPGAGHEEQGDADHRERRGHQPRHPAAAARGPRAQAPGEVGIGGRLVRGELRQGLPLAVGERAGTGLGRAFHGGTSVRDDVGVERH